MPKRTSMHQAIETMRTLSWGLLRQKRFASNAADALLMAAVAIGTLEGKPMGAFKLAQYIGMPRPTVIRRLAGMTRDGLVRRDARHRYMLTDEGRRRAAGVA